MLLVLVLCLKIAFVTSDQIDIRIQDNCTTPSGTPGKCKYLDECPEVIDIVANPIKINVNQQCESPVPNTIQVCCPEDDGPDVSDKRYCGYQHFDDLMVDLRLTSIIEFPWIAAFMKKTADGVPEIVCLGALINSRYVITSGYCSKKHSETKLWVRLGEFYLKNETDCVSWANINQAECNKYEDFEVEEAIVHPFMSQSIVYINDIGLIRLNTSVSFSDYVRPICIPSSLIEDEEVYTSGWVDNQFKVKVPSTVTTSKKCHGSENNVFLARYNRCIKYQTIASKAHSCSFLNNGAPIMFEHKNQWYLEGLSYLYFNQNNECISRYTPIAPYSKWIRNNIRK